MFKFQALISIYEGIGIYYLYKVNNGTEIKLNNLSSEINI